MLAYVMSRFPVITETFVLYEILEMERLGVAVEVFPLRRVACRTLHPEAEAMLAKTNFRPFFSLEILLANLRMLVRRPRRYLGALTEALFGTWGNWKFFAAALVFFPKVVRFAELMEARGVKHVHAHFASHPALAALLVHRLSGIGFSFTAHGTDLHASQKMLATKIAAACFTVTVSDYNRAFIAEAVGAELASKVEVVRCGVDLDVFSTGSRPPDAGNEERFEIVCVAALREVKGHEHLVEACALLRARGVDFRCRLIGEGPLEARLRTRIAQRGLQAHVVLEGAKRRAEVVHRLQQADVAVLASVQTRSGSREGVPVALMEAMACGCAVVASRLSGIPELVEDGLTGLLVEPGDPHALSEALERLQRDSIERRAMGAAGRTRVEAEYDLRANTKKLADLLRERSFESLGNATAVGAPAIKGGNRS